MTTASDQLGKGLPLVFNLNRGFLFRLGSVKLYGIKELTVCARRIIATPGSELDISAPNWNQQFTNRVTTGADGEKGNDGIDGPKGEWKERVWL